MENKEKGNSIFIIEWEYEGLYTESGYFLSRQAAERCVEDSEYEDHLFVVEVKPND